MMRKRNTDNFTSLIARNTEVSGDVLFTGALEVEGRVTGNIIAEDESSAEVRIREHGEVKGNIRAPSVIINGLVEGDVHSVKQLEMAAKARVIGDIYYASMEMVMGAEINGNLHREYGQAPRQITMDRPVAEQK